MNKKYLEKNIHSQCGKAVDMVIKSSLVRKSLDNVTCLMIAFNNFENCYNLLAYDNNMNSDKIPIKEIDLSSKNQKGKDTIGVIQVQEPNRPVSQNSNNVYNNYGKEKEYQLKQKENRDSERGLKEIRVQERKLMNNPYMHLRLEDNYNKPNIQTNRKLGGYTRENEINYTKSELEKQKAELFINGQYNQRSIDPYTPNIINSKLNKPENSKDDDKDIIFNRNKYNLYSNYGGSFTTKHSYNNNINLHNIYETTQKSQNQIPIPVQKYI